MQWNRKDIDFMKIYHTLLSFSSDQGNIFPALSHVQDACFFDIETTGLSFKRSHLCILGAAVYEEGKWQITQIFLESPLEEEEALKLFLALLSSRSLLIHYNGSTFDIPYLSGKSTMYNLDFPFENQENLDLYRRLRPFRKFFPVPSMKQKDLEIPAGFSRRDRLESSRISDYYKKYIMTRDQTALELLMLHNQDDIAGMAAILPLLSLERFFDRCCSVSTSLNGSGLIFHSQEETDLPFPLSFASGPFTFHAQKDGMELISAGTEETLKLFFSNYRDYYYLPEEDMAIHKSVGQFVDKSHRQRASAATCYQKKKDIFVTAPPGFSLLPLFARSYKDKETFCLRDDLAKDPAASRQYVHLTLQYLLRL